jgi:outer membrane protein
MQNAIPHRTPLAANRAIRFAAWLLFCANVLVQTPASGEELALKLGGDIGIGVYHTRSIVRDRRERAVVLPYTYFDYGRMFARIDTFGVKTLKLGYGYLELAGRVELDGFNIDAAGLRGLNERKSSIPLGIGTFQETPVGGFFVYALHDVNKSSGNLFDLTYVGKWETKGLTFYPQAGAEYLSKHYVNYYYGVSAGEAGASRFSRYQPGGAFNPFVAVMMEVKVAADWNVNLLVRHKWLAPSIYDSPIVSRKGMDTAFVSLAYRFK